MVARSKYKMQSLILSPFVIVAICAIIISFKTNFEGLIATLSIFYKHQSVVAEN